MRLSSPHPLRRRAFALAATCAALTGLGATPAAGASPVRITSPSAGATVSGGVKFTARSTRQTREVAFFVDGVRRWTSGARPFAYRRGQVLDTRRLSPGRHRLTVKAHLAGGRTAKHRIQIIVRRSVTPLRAEQARSPKSNGRTKTTTTTTTAPAPEPTSTTTTAPTTAAPTTATPAGSGQTIFAEPFDGDDFSKWDLVQAVATDRIRSSAETVRAGTRSGRFEVRHGDHVNGESNSRSELAWGGDMFTEGETHVFSWSTYFTSSFTVEDGWATTTQWKGDGTGGPPLEAGVNGDEFNISAGPHMDYKKLFAVPLVRGQWLDLTVKVHWSRDPAKGSVEIWYRGQKVIERFAMATLLPDRDNYFKLGLYRDASIVTTGVVFHDNLRIEQL